MFTKIQDIKPTSNNCLIMLKLAVCFALGFALLDSIFKAMLHYEKLSLELAIISYLVADLRYVCEQVIFVLGLLFVGTKFLETRTIFSVGFDSSDADKMSFKGPDEQNTIWIGRTYESALEAETVADALKSKIKKAK